MLAAKCLKAAQALDENHVKVQELAATMQKTMDGVLESLAPKIQEALKTELA